MPSLTFQIQRYIVKQLACDVPPETVAENIREQFLRDVDADTVARYHPAAGGGAEVPAKLRRLYERTRAEYGTEEAVERTFVAVATVSDFDDRSALCVEANGEDIALVEQGRAFHAIGNTCTHQGGPLCEGTLDDGEVECPWHGARFDVATGDPAGAPAVDGVDRYEVRVRGEDVEVKV